MPGKMYYTAAGQASRAAGGDAPTPVVIRDFDSALSAVLLTWSSMGRAPVSCSEEANVRIKLEGAQWDGAVDYKVAEFVVRLQKSLLAVYNRATGANVRYNTEGMDAAGLRVVVTVERGCTLFNIDLKGWWDNMESRHKLAATLGAAAILGGAALGIFWHKDVTERDIARINGDASVKAAQIKMQETLELKAQERLADESRRRDFMEQMGGMLRTVGQNSRYMYHLAAKLQPGDRMTLNDEAAIPAETAKRLYRSPVHRQPVTTPQAYMLDGEYVVSHIDREKDSVIVHIGDAPRVFTLVWLDDAALARFYNYCAQRRREGEKALPPIPLQLTALFKSGAFKEGRIDNIGPRRPEAVSFTEAAVDSARSLEGKDGTDDGGE